jgi:peptidoglycan/xylan/chitin deacetylase (PgdA/CDA1 family)
MYHQIRADGGGDYDLTPAEFRRELEQLYRLGYRPVRAIDLVTGRLDVPAGKSPVVLTFDDSTKEQLAYGPNGQVKPDTAVGIMLTFARKHPDFKLAGTFFVNREPFAGVREGPAMLRFLVKSGFEIGNHTDDHIPFNEKDATGVQKALVRGKRIITRAVPGAAVRTMALPLGVEPRPASLAVSGRWHGESYRNDGVFLVGAGPAPSPFSRAWRPAAIPRIKTGPWHGGEPDFASGFWLDVLRRHPERRYVSDGDPSRISFPRRLASQLKPRLRGRADPY